MEEKKFETTLFYVACYLMYCSSVENKDIKFLCIDRGRENKKFKFIFSGKELCNALISENIKVDFALYGNSIKKLKGLMYDSNY